MIAVKNHRRLMNKFYYLPKRMKLKIEEAGNTTLQVLVARVV